MKCEVLIDWLTFSVKNEVDPREVIKKYLGMDPLLFQDPGFGILGYKKMLTFGNIQVMYEGRENTYFKDMGICVSMSGKGCRQFESMSKLAFEGARDKQGTRSVAFPVLFQMLASSPDVNVTRVDVACDDKAEDGSAGALDMGEIISCVRAGSVNSRLAKRTIFETMNAENYAGSSVYLGAPSSDFRVRIYDKAAEQGSGEHWIRVELVLKAKNANAFVSQMTNSENVGKLAAQIFNDKFSFIERDDSNITRCSVCDWWSAFVDELGSVHLVARAVVQHSIERVNDWVTEQVGPSIAMLLQTLGWDQIRNIALQSISRLSSKQEALIADYNNLKLAAAFG